MDPLSVLVGGLLFLGGVVLGMFRTLHKPKATTLVVETCGCSHASAFHNRETSECFAKVMRSTDNGPVWGKCTCQRYTGPPVLEDFVPRD